VVERRSPKPSAEVRFLVGPPLLANQARFPALLTREEGGLIRCMSKFEGPGGKSEKSIPSRIAEIKERIKQIEDGTFPISETDPDLKATILKNLRERLEINEEDLLIAGGSKPSYELQITELEKEIGPLVESYARRWEEVSQSGDESRIRAFLGDSRRDVLDYPDRSPYENAKRHAEADLGQHTGDYLSPRSLRDAHLHFKNKLEDVLRRSEK
jgi:hypothetical protein